jgi:hypothetical protein
MRRCDISEMAAADANAATATVGTETKATVNAKENQIVGLEDLQLDWAGSDMVSEGSPNC